MKLDEERKFYKQKGFYVSCLLALFAVLSVIAVQKKLSTTQEQEIAKVEETTLPSTDAPHTFASVTEETGKVSDFAELPTEEPIAFTAAPIDMAKKEAPKSDSSITAQTETLDEDNPEEAEQDNTVAVINTEDEEQGLTWPVNGDILLPYNIDEPVYFPTLGQYKVNPAVIIAGKEDEPVVSACACKITKVKRTEELGLTITAVSGDYTYIYGQLANPKVAKGDIVKEGQPIASLAKPSRFYKKEGCNLYFQVKDGKDSVNPLLLLK